MVPEQAQSVAAIVIPRGPLVYYVPSLRRVFDFGFFTDIFPLAFSEKVACVLAKQFASAHSRTYNLQKFHQMSNVVRHLASDEILIRGIAAACVSGRMRDSSLISEGIRSWFASKKAELYPNRGTTLAGRLNALKAGFRPLIGAGLIGTLTYPKMPAGYSAYKMHKPSLVERGKRNVLCDEIVGELRRLASELGIELTPDAAGYVAGIGKTVPSELLVNEEVFRGAFQRINSRRMQAIRNLAEDALLASYALFEDGEAACAQAPPGIADRIQYELERYKRGCTDKLDALFPLTDPLRAVGNLLTYCRERHAGLIPHHKVYRKYCAGRYMMRLCHALGGRRHLKRMLGCGPDGIAGAALIYLVDSGDNVSSALALSPNCIEPTDEPNRVRVLTYKGRSDWQAVVNTFEVKDPRVRVTVPQAIEMVLRMTHRVRQEYPAFADTLLMFRFYDEPSAAADVFLASRLRRLLRASGDTAVKEMLPGAIRQSFLIDRTLIADGRTRVAEILAKHRRKGSSTIHIYAERWPIKLLYAAKIRTFQHILETDLVFNGLKLDEALGMTSAEAKNLLQTAERTGNGLRCRDPKAGEGPTSALGEDCEDAGAPCFGCKMRLFVVDRETVEDAVRTKLHLESQRDVLEAMSPAKWEAEMLPELAFATAVIENLRRSKHASLLSRVEREVANRSTGTDKS